MSSDMSTLPEVYHGPEYNPHNVDPAARAPEIAQQYEGYSGKVDPHQSLPPYKDEYTQQQQQQVPQSPWTPPPQGYAQQQHQPFMPPQQQFVPQQQQLQPPVLAKRNTVCGMKSVMFWILIVVIFIIIVGAGVGAGVGISMKKKGSSWQPYALQTGAWNINNIPLSQHNGICTNDNPNSAVTGCGPLNFPFIINKVGDNYQISSSPYAEMNGLLSQPVGEGDLYQKSFYSSGQLSSISSPCNSIANVTVKLGKSYQYEITNEHTTQLGCQLDNGATTTPNQKCNCYWFGTLTQ